MLSRSNAGFHAAVIPGRISALFRHWQLPARRMAAREFFIGAHALMAIFEAMLMG